MVVTINGRHTVIAYKILRKTEDGLFSSNGNVPIIYRKHYRRHGVNFPAPGTKLFVFDTVEHAAPHLSDKGNELWQVEVPALYPMRERAEMAGDSKSVNLFWKGFRHNAVRTPAGTCVVDWLRLVKKVK